MAGDIDDQGLDFIVIDQDGTGPGFYSLPDRRVSFQDNQSQKGIDQDEKFRGPLRIGVE